jgi:hypothetical protein
MASVNYQLMDELEIVRNLIDKDRAAGLSFFQLLQEVAHARL